MKHKHQQLQANTDTLNEKWVEVLSAKQDMEDRCHSSPKSYPPRHLLPEFDEELADDHVRPLRGQDRPTGENLNDQPPPCHYVKDPVDYLDPQDVLCRIEAKMAPTRSIYGSRGRAPAGLDGYDAWMDRNDRARDQAYSRLSPNL